MNSYMTGCLFCWFIKKLRKWSAIFVISMQHFREHSFANPSAQLEVKEQAQTEVLKNEVFRGVKRVMRTNAVAAENPLPPTKVRVNSASL